MEVFADIAVGWNVELMVLKRGAEPREEFRVKGGGELAELEADARTGVVGVFVVALTQDGSAPGEFFLEAIAKADAGAGVVQADARQRRRRGRRTCSRSGVGRSWRVRTNSHPWVVGTQVMSATQTSSGRTGAARLRSRLGAMGWL
jgi:hypothetical protein